MKYNMDTLFNKRVVKPKKNTILSIEDYKRAYEFDIHLDRFEANTPIDTKAVFIKGDKETSILKARIHIKNTPLNLDGYTITTNVQEGFSDVVTLPVEIVEANGGLVQISLTSTKVDEQGENTFELCLQKGTEILVTQLYKYTVLNSLGEGEVGSEEELSTLQSLIAQVQEKIEIVDEIVTELEITGQDIDDILEMVGGL